MLKSSASAAASKSAATVSSALRTPHAAAAPFRHAPLRPRFFVNDDVNFGVLLASLDLEVKDTPAHVLWLVETPDAATMVSEHARAAKQHGLDKLRLKVCARGCEGVLLVASVWDWDASGDSLALRIACSFLKLR